MKIIFFGTPEFVLPVLDQLSKAHQITAVVTQPPRLVGREQFRQFSAVDTWAYKKHIPIFFEPAKIVEENVEADLGVLAAYGEIIPKNVIRHFKFGILNVHPSLLPKWRGASPIQSTIISGELEGGVTIIKLDEKLDHGPIISTFKDEVTTDDTTDSLRRRLFERSGIFLNDLIPVYTGGKVKPKEQDHSKATFCKLIKKADGFIPLEYLSSILEGKASKKSWIIRNMDNYKLTVDAVSIERFIRAMNPWPFAWTEVTINDRKNRLKILSAHLEDNKLVLDQVQIEGKNPVTWSQFKEGYPAVMI